MSAFIVPVAATMFGILKFFLDFGVSMGAIRLFLAFVVVVHHLRAIILKPAGLDTPKYYKLGMNAGFAMMFFYIISGFLISTALSEKYPPTSKGTAQFYRSRFIRIFSLYWPMVAIVFIALPFTRAEFASNSMSDKFTNLFLLGIDWRLSFADYPADHWNAAIFSLRQAWTLGPELTFYILAPFILRSRKAALAIFAGSAITRAICIHMVGFRELWTYYFLPSTILFFMLGHLVQTAAQEWRALRSPKIGCAVLFVSVCCLLVGSYADWDSLRFWFAVLFFALSLPGIFAATKDTKLLNMLGDLSFPVYLVQLLVIVEANNIGLFRAMPHSALVVLIVALAMTFVCAVATHWLLEKPTAWVMRTAALAFRRDKIRRRPDGVSP